MQGLSKLWYTICLGAHRACPCFLPVMPCFLFPPPGTTYLSLLHYRSFPGEVDARPEFLRLLSLCESSFFAACYFGIHTFWHAFVSGTKKASDPVRRDPSVTVSRPHMPWPSNICDLAPEYYNSDVDLPISHFARTASTDVRQVRSDRATL